ncbi:Gfo/Idh/MocA family oxidoreductase [Kocuria sp. JC486]|nr:Gfo/Idh/MocA family oxidoreductase [Kocuria sp. JC486]NHU85986.1 Gfo/Idh/MocA family oxidoreductase [Kocuria sp. JC486]
MRIATIGTSSIGSTFARAIGAVDGVEHVAVMSRDRSRGEAFAAETNRLTGDRARVVTSLEELANASDVDAVYIASPNALHFPQANTLLRAGKHVLLEKSAACDRRQFQELVDTAESTGVVVLEAMRSVHDPGFARIRELLPQLGPLRRAELRLCQYSSRYGKFLAGETPAIFDPSLGAGALMDIGTYCTHPMVALWGVPERIHAAATILRSGADGAGTVLCGFDSPAGFSVSLHYSKITTSPLSSTIEGERATLEIDSVTTPRNLVLHGTDGSTDVVTVDGDGGGSGAPENMRYELLEFLRLADAPRGQRDDEALARHQAASLGTLAVLDAVRAQIGVRFPSDQA